ncbi:MAG: FecR domain-containing protein, partial [Deltaproteobacteria bacterium]|nr:FecR domain-containing protein [Deltaproteobacteria bacterium]
MLNRNKQATNSSCRKYLFSAMAVVVVAVFGLTVPDAFWGATKAGKITYMKPGSNVDAYRSNAWTPLKTGSSVLQGDTIRTGRKSRVEIVLKDESIIRLGSRSKVKIKAALFEGSKTRQFSAKMMRGKAYAVVSKMVGSESEFKVETSNAVAGVRGTTFRIDSKLDKSTVVRVYTGAVAVSNAPIYAKPGKTATTKTSGKFQMPRKGVKPGGPGRVEVAGPKEVTKKEWEEFV